MSNTKLDVSKLNKEFDMIDLGVARSKILNFKVHQHRKIIQLYFSYKQHPEKLITHEFVMECCKS